LKMGARRRPKDKKFFLSPSTFFPILEEGPPWSLLSSNFKLHNENGNEPAVQPLLLPLSEMDGVSVFWVFCLYSMQFVVCVHFINFVYIYWLLHAHLYYLISHP
jgi:hypothetical protein